MKINEIKHNHSLTDLLKVLLFSILMLLPFIDVGVRCGYVMLNKNAYQSYYGETINERELESVNYDNLVSNEEYVWNSETFTYSFNDILNIYIENPTFNNISYNANILRLQSNTSNNTNYLFLYNNTQYVKEFNLNTQNVYGEFKYLYKGNTYTNDIYNYFYQYQYNNYSYLDNVFEYSVSQLEESNLYNWTTQTAIYSGVSQMTTQLGITTNIIPIIVCYWFFMTIIYIILDIVIKLFTILTHFIGSKTAM